MLDALERLEAIISQFVNGDLALPENFEHTIWKKEKVSFLGAVILEIKSLSTANQIEYCVRWCQDNLVKLTDQLFDSLENPDKSRHSIRMFLDLFFEFQKIFSKDFNIDVPIPVALCYYDSERLMQIMDELVSMFRSAGIEARLLEIIFKPIIEYVQPAKVGNVSFRQYLYLNVYVNELLTADLKGTKYHDKELAIVEILIRLNYNHIRLLGYVSSKILQLASEVQTLVEKSHIYLDFKKIINQISVYEDLSYDVRLEPIKNQLADWLDEEINYLVHSQSAAVGDESKMPSLKLNLSVAQMAYLTSLFYNHNVFRQPVKRKIIETITDTFSSAETNKISIASFKARFQRPNDSTVRNIRKLLKGMIADTDAFLN